MLMLVSDADKERISAAIRVAESKTSGEIFCVIAHRTSDYRLYPFTYAAGLSLLVPLPFILFSYWPSSAIYTAQLAVFILLNVVLRWPPIRFHIVPRRRKHERAHAEAMSQFFAHGLEKTEKRTGVLIFAAAAERYAEIIADAGINEKVPREVWDDAIAALTSAIADGQAGDGFIAAIEKCGAVLAQHFPPGALQRDELPDKLVEI
jgi:putative membrane protein